jgi:hypothetical protein
VKYYLQTKQTQLRETGKVVANDEKFRWIDNDSILRLEAVRDYLKSVWVDTLELTILIQQIKKTIEQWEKNELIYESSFVGQLSEVLQALANTLTNLKSLSDTHYSTKVTNWTGQFQILSNNAMHLKGRAEIQGHREMINLMKNLYGYTLPIQTLQLGFIGSSLACIMYSIMITSMGSISRIGMQWFDLPAKHPDRIDPSAYLWKILEQLKLYMDQAKEDEKLLNNTL